MPAQNSRSIVIRGGAIGGFCFFVRFGSGGSIAVGGAAAGGSEGAEGAEGAEGSEGAGAGFVFARFRFGWAGSCAGAGSGADSGAGSGAAGSGAGGVSAADSMAASGQAKLKSPVGCWFCLVLREE